MGSTFHLRPLNYAAVMVVLSLPVAPARAADELLAAARQLQSQYAADLETLARWCDEHQLAEQARATRAWCAKPADDTIRVCLLPREFGKAELAYEASPEVRQWRERFFERRRKQAEDLYQLARRCVRARRASLAFDLMLSAGRDDPDNENVRRVFGYQKHEDGWYTPYELAKLRAGQVWHDRFGWILKADVARYESGQRFDGKRWIKAEEDAKLHADIANGWTIETEHYAIRTNHSLEAGVELGTKLERLFRVWAQLFVRYYSSESAVAALFDGRPRSAPPSAQRMAVVYFRDRDDYNRALRPILPNVEITNGYYLGRARRAYFFADPSGDDGTLYHEATHQLFFQSRPVSPSAGVRGNFWIIEGIAMYLESLRPDGDTWVLGGARDVRMNAAAVRLVRDDFYVPFGELVGYGMEQIQADPRIATLYSQMAGQTHFLIHYEGGRYRDSLVSYLTEVYSGQDRLTTLAQLTGEDFATLDKQYRRFVEELAKDRAPDVKDDHQGSEEGSRNAGHAEVRNSKHEIRNKSRMAEAAK